MSTDPLKHANNTDVLAYPIALAQVDFREYIMAVGYSTKRVTEAEAVIELHSNGIVRISRNGADTIVSPSMWTSAVSKGHVAADTDSSLAVTHAAGIAPPKHYDNNLDLVDAPVDAPRRGPGRPRRSV